MLLLQFPLTVNTTLVQPSTQARRLDVVLDPSLLLIPISCGSLRILLLPPNAFQICPPSVVSFTAQPSPVHWEVMGLL